jgi:outer membrane protein
MRCTQNFKFLMVLISSTFLSLPSFGAPPEVIVPCPQENPCGKKAEEDPCIVSLELTLERTYMQNAELDAARAGLRATDEDVSQANADWRPSLSVEGAQTESLSRPIGLGVRTHGNSTGYVATLSQNVFHGGATVAQIGVAESNVFAGNAGLFITEQNTLLGAVQAHTAVVANAAILEYQKESEQFNKKFLERTQARYEVGEVSRTDVAASEAQYEGAEADVINALGTLESSKANYERQVGNPPGRLATPNIILQIPKCYEEALAIAKVRNPAITQARYALAAAEYNVDLQIAALLPTIDVNGTVGNDRRGGTGFIAPAHPKRTNIGFGATMTVPVYLQGKPSSRVRQAYQTVAQQKVLLVNTQRQVVEATRVAWENYVTAQNSLKNRIAQVKAQELAVEGAVEESNVGVKSVIDVLVEQDKLIVAQIDLVNAQQTLIVATYQVLQAMGRLTACELKLNVKYYDPDSYYNEYKDAWIQFWQGEDLRYVKDEL